MAARMQQDAVKATEDGLRAKGWTVTDAFQPKGPRSQAVRQPGDRYELVIDGLVRAEVVVVAGAVS